MIKKAIVVLVVIIASGCSQPGVWFDDGSSSGPNLKTIELFVSATMVNDATIVHTNETQNIDTINAELPFTKSWDQEISANDRFFLSANIPLTPGNEFYVRITIDDSVVAEARSTSPMVVVQYP